MGVNNLSIAATDLNAVFTWITNLVVVRRPRTKNASKTVSLGGTERFVEARHLVMVQLTPFTVQHTDTLTDITHDINVIRPLSGTSSFSNDIVRFIRFFVYNGDRVSHFLEELKVDKQSLPTSCIPLCYLETEKTTLIFHGYCVYNQPQNIQPSLPM